MSKASDEARKRDARWIRKMTPWVKRLAASLKRARLRRALLVILCFPCLSHAENIPGKGIPEALPRNTVQVTVADGFGMGAPIGPGQIVTAWHVVKGQAETIQWFAKNGDHGSAILTCKDVEHDIATLLITSGGPLRDWFHFDRLPMVGDRLFWTSYLFDGETITWVSGNYMGRDKTDMMAVDGPLFPGASGGPIVTEGGLLVGIVQTANAAPTQSEFFRPYLGGRDPRGICGIK